MGHTVKFLQLVFKRQTDQRQVNDLSLASIICGFEELKAIPCLSNEHRVNFF